MTSSCLSDPASVTAACQSFRPRYMPVLALPAVNLALPGKSRSDLEPHPHRILEGAELEDALCVAADFIDLKSPFMAGHSRRCAQLSADAGTVLGFTATEITTLRRAGLVHELSLI